MELAESKSNPIVYLKDLPVGSPFHVPNTNLFGIIIKHGQMGTRVIMDGCVKYNAEGHTLYERRIETIGNRTECIENENKHTSSQLKAITGMGDENTINSGENRTSEI